MHSLSALKIAVPYLLTLSNPYGEMAHTLASYNNQFYASEDEHFARLTFWGYHQNLYLEPWAVKTCPLSILYSPDQYEYLKLGDKALEFTSDYRIETKTSPLIETRDGMDSYLQRLTSKHRSEVRKLLKEVSTWKLHTSHSMSLGIADEKPTPELLNFINSAYTEIAGYHSSLLDATELSQKYKTEITPIVLLYGLISGQIKSWDNCDARILILSLTDDMGDKVCDTLALSMFGGFVLHLFADINKGDNYYAKKACTAQIEWAATNGYSFVDIGNEVIDSESINHDSRKRAIYKTIFYTRSEHYEIPGFYTDSFGYENHLKRQGVDSNTDRLAFVHSQLDDAEYLANKLVMDLYGVPRAELIEVFGELKCSLTTEHAGLLYQHVDDKYFYDKPSPNTPWGDYRMHSNIPVGAKVSHNLEWTDNGYKIGVVNLTDKTLDDVETWINSIKTNSKYLSGSRYKELSLDLQEISIASYEDFDRFLMSKETVIEKKCGQFSMNTDLFIKEECLLYRVLAHRKNPIKSIVTFIAKDPVGRLVFDGYSYVLESGECYASFMYVENCSETKKRYSPATVYHTALVRLIKQNYPHVKKVNFMVMLPYKDLFNFEVERVQDVRYCEDL